VVGSLGKGRLKPGHQVELSTGAAAITRMIKWVDRRRCAYLLIIRVTHESVLGEVAALVGSAPSPALCCRKRARIRHGLRVQLPGSHVAAGDWKTRS
jgi:hypothetical protein